MKIGDSIVQWLLDLVAQTKCQKKRKEKEYVYEYEK